MFEGFERGKKVVDGTHISYVIGGSGGPPLLFLHGFPQCKAMWARVAPKLTSEYTVICADLRGYGDSDKPRATDPSSYSFRRMAADQLDLMQQLGFPRFHLVGHDRGARCGHRLALDHQDSIITLTIMDIVPTYTMFMETDRRVAGSYWHWYFLAQPAPFPERLIGNDPDFFYETCLVGWGKTKISDFDAEMLAEYRRAWRDPEMIRGSCCDYRAAAEVDLQHDAADQDRRVTCPTLVLYGAAGVMARLFDIPAQWRARCIDATDASLPGGHFFVDQYPAQTVEILRTFLSRHEEIC